MKRFILACLITAGLSLGAAPTASAEHLPALQVKSGVLGPGKSVVVSYSVECIEGSQVYFYVTVRQKAGREFNTAGGSSYVACTVTGTQTFKTDPLFGQGPFRTGKAVAEAVATICDPSSFDCASESKVTEFSITR